MKEICPKKGKTTKINSREMRCFRIFFRPRKLVPAKINFLKVVISWALVLTYRSVKNCQTNLSRLEIGFDSLYKGNPYLSKILGSALVDFKPKSFVILFRHFIDFRNRKQIGLFSGWKIRD